MDYENMSKEELVKELRDLNNYMENVIVLWGDKRDLFDTFKHVANNPEGEYTADESTAARILVEAQGAFDEFISVLRDSFDRGGINYVLSEKVSAIMQEVADRHSKAS